MASDIKNEVLQLIEATDNEELLQLIKADIEFFSDSGKDITDGLSLKEIEELKRLSEEPDSDDTMNEDEFVKATARWRTK